MRLTSLNMPASYKYEITLQLPFLIFISAYATSWFKPEERTKFPKLVLGKN